MYVCVHVCMCAFEFEYLSPTAPEHRFTDLLPLPTRSAVHQSWVPWTSSAVYHRNRVWYQGCPATPGNRQTHYNHSTLYICIMGSCSFGIFTWYIEWGGGQWKGYCSTHHLCLVNTKHSKCFLPRRVDFGGNWKYLHHQLVTWTVALITLSVTIDVTYTQPLTFCPISAFVNVDFPAFGAPMTADLTILRCSCSPEWKTVRLSVTSLSVDAFADQLQALVTIGSKRNPHLAPPTIRLNSSSLNTAIRPWSVTDGSTTHNLNSAFHSWKSSDTSTATTS